MRLRQKAEREGINIDYLVKRLLEERFPPSPAGSISQKEADLLKKINKGFPEKFWKKYFALIDKRDADNISPDELAELTGYSTKIEKGSAERLKHLIELASLKNMDLDDLIENMGIRPRHHV